MSGGVGFTTSIPMKTCKMTSPTVFVRQRTCRSTIPFPCLANMEGTKWKHTARCFCINLHPLPRGYPLVGWESVAGNVFSRVLKVLGGRDLASLRLTCRSWRGLVDANVEELRPVAVHRYASIGQLFPNIRRLDLTHAEVVPAGLADVQFLTHLVELRLSQFDLILDRHLACISTLTRLKSLHLKGAHALRGEGFSLLSGLCGLTELHLFGCNLSRRGLLSLENNFPGLRSLRLTACRSLSTDDLCTLSNCRNLTSLNLSRTDSVDKRVFESLFGLHGLVHLDASMCPLVDNDAVQAAAKLQHLEKLILRSGKGGRHSPRLKLTNASLVDIAGLRALTVLDLAGNTALSDAGIIGLSQIKTLTELNLSGTAVGFEGARAIARLPVLRCLDVSHCWNITDQCVAALRWGCPNLYLVRLVGCKKVSAVASLKLLRSLKMRVIPRGVAKLQCHYPFKGFVKALLHSIHFRQASA